MAKVLIFGVNDFAQLGCFYLRHDSPHEVVGFTVDSEFVPRERSFEGLPVVAFEDVERSHPPADFLMFAPMSHRRMNSLRQRVYERIKKKGYRFVSYVSSRATTFTDLSIGENCFILEDNTIQPFAKIGNDVVLWSGNHIGHHSVIGDHVLFTSHVVLSGHCVVEPFSFFGVNATIRDGVRIGEGTFVAMSASVIGDTEPWSVYKGVPARKAATSSKDLD